MLRVSTPNRQLFYFHGTSPTEIYTLSLHDALPISSSATCWSTSPATPTAPSCASTRCSTPTPPAGDRACSSCGRSEEHTSELQSRENLVCRLLLEKKRLYHTNGPSLQNVSSVTCFS